MLTMSYWMCLSAIQTNFSWIWSTSIRIISWLKGEKLLFDGCCFSCSLCERRLTGTAVTCIIYVVVLSQTWQGLSTPKVNNVYFPPRQRCARLTVSGRRHWVFLLWAQQAETWTAGSVWLIGPSPAGGCLGVVGPAVWWLTWASQL